MSIVQEFTDIFAPMDKKYCDLFFAISVFWFIILVITVFQCLFLFRDLKKNKFLIIQSVILMATLFVNYIYNRLLFNMCK